MNEELRIYLQARELEAFFREKIHLEYKGEEGAHSQYTVAQINDHEPRYPITLSYCKYPQDAALDLSVDLREKQQGIANITFELAQRKLEDFYRGKDRICLIPTVQTAVQDRPNPNAEEICGQSIDAVDGRQLRETFGHPLQFLKDTLTPGFLRKQPDETTVQAGEEHYLSNRLMTEHVNAIKDSPEEPVQAPPSPLFIHNEDENNAWFLPTNQDRQVSFYESAKDGQVCRTCYFEPVHEGDEPFPTQGLDYSGVKLFNDGVTLYRATDGTPFTFAFSEIEQVQQQTQADKTANKGEMFGPDFDFLPQPIASFLVRFQPSNDTEREIFNQVKRDMWDRGKPSHFDLARIGDPSLLRYLYESSLESKDAMTRKDVVKNPRCPADILGKVYWDPAWEVRDAAAANPNISKETLLKMINYETNSAVKEFMEDTLKQRFPEQPQIQQASHAQERKPSLDSIISKAKAASNQQAIKKINPIQHER